MAVPVAIAGAGIAARGFASWLAKKKATEAAAKAAVRSTGAASIPNLVSGSRVSRGGLGGYANVVGAGGAGTAAIKMTQQPNGGDLHPRIEAMERLRNPRVGMAGLGGGYMANPMPNQDPSYDASMTQEGQIQTMMEEMDGMDISEEAKYAIIRDKLDLPEPEPIKEIPDKYLDLIPTTGGAPTPRDPRKIKMFMGRPY